MKKEDLPTKQENLPSIESIFHFEGEDSHLREIPPEAQLVDKEGSPCAASEVIAIF